MFDNIFSIYALLLGLVALVVAALRLGMDSRTPVLASAPYCHLQEGMLKHVSIR